MAIDKNSNGFTIGFAIIMVIVVGAGLSIAAMGLKPFQVKNMKREKMQNVLAAVNVQASRVESEDLFHTYVKNRIIIDSSGNKVNEVSGDINRTNKDDAFNIDVKKQFKQVGPGNIDCFPLYVVKKDSETYYVIPMAGTGLWGPVWGFISIKDDYNTVYGATFDHKTETPGLGAEIANKAFQDQFKGEKILDEDGNFVSIDVVKGTTTPENKHAVDGITGGTITSHGVRDMLDRTIGNYIKFFEKVKAGDQPS